MSVLVQYSLPYNSSCKRERAIAFRFARSRNTQRTVTTLHVSPRTALICNVGTCSKGRVLMFVKKNVY